ncbi:protein phosphatase 2C domain-containing protein [Pleurocapsales cyanobacterium LEGE 06147]|nr:protein phosphatase 2C domain-containing protein [Pleurocapsales cyanobacterium LEGE 06147]
MPNQIIAFSVPKIGEEQKNNQDRFESSSDGSLTALADGAGSSLYPSKWAEILVQSFCQDLGNPIARIQRSHQEWLKPAQEQWRQYYLAKLTNPNRKWWEVGSQIKDRGSATFIGLSLPTHPDSEAQKWQAVAIGDSCLFKLERNSENLFAFPLNNSGDFKTTTQCFESLPEYSSFSPQFIEGYCNWGDTFLLASDALAHWLLTDYENQSQEWQKIFELKKIEDFRQAIDRLRQNNLIKNDDTTAVLIKPEFDENDTDP